MGSTLQRLPVGILGFGDHTALFCECSASEPKVTFASKQLSEYRGEESRSGISSFTQSSASVQHLQYLPYGEPYINQRISNYNERFTFTGKERDEETGYGYFGARHMDHELMTGWLSVDPMSDKYPSLSPYNYCAGNPVKLVDPNGKEMWKPEVLANGSVNYIKEAGDNAKTLQKQYGLTKSNANRLYGTMKNGKISGNEVQKVTGSKILKYNSSYKNSKKSQDIKQKIYHAGFAALYSHVNGDGTFKLNDFFTGLGDDYSGIVSRDGWGNRPPISIPKLGGGDIPINDFSCQSGGSPILHLGGDVKVNINFRDIRTGELVRDGCSITYYQDAHKTVKNEMPGFAISFNNNYLNDIKVSYID